MRLLRFRAPPHGRGPQMAPERAGDAAPPYRSDCPSEPARRSDIARSHQEGGSAMRQFNDRQLEQAAALIDRLPWGDVDISIRTMEDSLRRAMEATRADFLLWEETLEPRLEAEHGW